MPRRALLLFAGPVEKHHRFRKQWTKFRGRVAPAIPSQRLGVRRLGIGKAVTLEVAWHHGKSAGCRPI